MANNEKVQLEEAPAQKNGRKRALLGAGAAVAVLAGAATYAAFTSNANIGSEFTTGSIELQLNDEPGSSSFSATPINLKGNEATYIPLKIDNVGTLDGELEFIDITGDTGGDADNLDVGLSYLGTSSGTCTETTFNGGTVKVSPDTPVSQEASWNSAFSDAQNLESGTSHYYCYSFTGTEQGLNITPTWNFTLTETTLP